MTAARRGSRSGNQVFVRRCAGEPHQWYDGTPHPWEFKRVWHLEPSLTDVDGVYAGREDAALFRSQDGGQTVAGALGVAGTWLGAALAAGCGRDVPAYGDSGSE